MSFVTRRGSNEIASALGIDPGTDPETVPETDPETDPEIVPETVPGIRTRTRTEGEIGRGIAGVIGPRPKKQHQIKRCPRKTTKGWNGRRWQTFYGKAPDLTKQSLSLKLMPR